MQDQEAQQTHYDSWHKQHEQTHYEDKCYELPRIVIHSGIVPHIPKFAKRMSDPTEQETYRKNIDGRLDSQDVMLDKILTQAKYTNGRVNQLEVDRAIFQAQLSVVRRMMYVVGAVLVFVVGQVVIPLFTPLIQSGKPL